MKAWSCRFVKLSRSVHRSESVVSGGFSKVHIPSKDNVDAHCRTHVPHRDWCFICVQAKKRHPPHLAVRVAEEIRAATSGNVLLGTRADRSLGC